MNFTPNTKAAGGACTQRNFTFWKCGRFLLLALVMSLGSFTAQATTLTIKNTGCQTMKVYKVVLFSEVYQTTLDPTQSWSAFCLFGEKWVYRSMSGTQLGTYNVPLGLFLTHEFNTGGAPAAPVVGSVSQPSCSVPTGTVTLNGLPSSGTWTLTRNPGNIAISGTGSSTTIYGLTSGNYSFTVKSGSCTSPASANVAINVSPSAISAPALTTLVATNTCPANTVNLTALAPTFLPSGFSLTWHTGSPATSGNKISNPNAVGAGFYYAAFYNASSNCYSGNKTTKVTATVGNCSNLVRDKYRSLDGSLNNLTNSATTSFGAVGNAFARELPADYADGIQALAGTNRPNPRALSNKLSREEQDDHNDREMAGLFYIWGQFIDHDMTDNATSPSDPASISLPSSEQLFTNPITFFRSKVHPGTGVTSPRDQTNLNSAWLDASMVYGLTPSHAQWLRTGSRGKMKVSKGNMLPFNTLTGEYDSAIDPNAPRMDDDQGGTKKTFVAGDHRVAEHPGLTSMHTLFVREHNRICDNLVSQGLTNDEEIYQKARKEIGALIQHVTYTQWMSAMGIQLTPYSGYKPNVHPDILNTFSTAAYRWHTMVENDIILRDNECYGVGEVELALKDIFFNIGIVRKYDIGVILKGLSVHRQYETDLKVNNGLRNFLAGNFGTDLVSINIQRGRDHGLPSYNTVRAYYTGQPAYSFSDIAVDSVAQKLQSIYSSVDDIDLWVGLFAEPRMPGKSIGKTLNAIITAQFEKLRDGDYYFYQNDPELSSILAQIQSTKLSNIISRNSTAANFQDNVFIRKFCSSEGDDIAHHPCNVQMDFEGWTNLGKNSTSYYYKWNGGDMNFDDAKSHGVVLGGDLPQIQNYSENNALKGFLGGASIWLDMARNGANWKYNDYFNNADQLVVGANVNYFNWVFGEPNNYGGTENRVEFTGSGKWNDLGGTYLKTLVSEVGCDNNLASCVAGKAAPALTSYTKSNDCPATTVDLSTVTASNKPKNTVITWHTGTPAKNSNKISNVTAVGAGTYYAAFYSASNNCYSGTNGSGTTAYTVVINDCTPVNNGPDCANIVVTGSAGKITVTGLDGAPVSSLQILTTAWQQQYSCFANCGTSQTVNLPAGTYLVYAKYYTAGYQVICEKQVTVTVTGNNICDNLTNGGTIGFGTNCTGSIVHCPSNGNVATITNCNAPTGGTGNIEVMWLKSTTSCVAPTTTAAQVMAGQDPHWTVVQGATSLDFNPGAVTQNTCYLRCSRRAGCDVFLESNIISLSIDNNCGNGGNNTPNCSNISITPSGGTITVAGLNGAPITSVQIFSSNWQQLHNCFGNCGGPTASYPVPAGSYFVYVKYYSANYQYICEVNQTVNVNSSAEGQFSKNLDFNAIQQLEFTELVWIHNGDFEVDEYVLERSADGVLFEEIALKGAENDVQADFYTEYDFNPMAGNNYYRLRLKNLDGSNGYSETRLVTYAEITDYTIFPNPANSFASIDLEHAIGKPAEIFIFDNKGVRVKSYQLGEIYSKYHQMDLRDMHEGHYIVWVSIPGKRPVAKTLIIGRM